MIQSAVEGAPMQDQTVPSLFAVSPAGPGQWSGAGLERFEQPDGSQFGGYVMGLMVAALLREPDRRGTPAALTGVFPGRTGVGPLTVATRVLRTGRSLQVWQAEVVQAERLCAQATVTFAERPGEGPSFCWIEPPAAPPPESLPRDILPPPAAGFLNTFDRRMVFELFHTPRDGASLMWTRDPDGGVMGYPRLTMFADMFPPRAALALGQFTPSMTVSNSIYFHATEEEIAGAGDDFVLSHGRGRRGGGGICDLTAQIWRRDGVLLATTEQLWWFR